MGRGSAALPAADEEEAAGDRVHQLGDLHHAVWAVRGRGAPSERASAESGTVARILGVSCQKPDGEQSDEPFHGMHGESQLLELSAPLL